MLMRSRNIKPNFFKNEVLAECDPLARILYEGLWCMADREGRLECRPKRIKAEVLPYDNCNIDKLLNILVSKNFITIYTVDKADYILIPSFKKHQNPHIKEAASVLPAPIDEVPRTMPVLSGEIPGITGESMVQECLIPDSLIPDSLIPDSLIPDSKPFCSKDDFTEDFENFWKEYPRKVGKKEAYKKWLATLKADKGTSPEQLILAATNYAGYCRRTKKEMEYIKHPSTFLGPCTPWQEWLAGASGSPTTHVMSKEEAEYNALMISHYSGSDEGN